MEIINPLEMHLWNLASECIPPLNRNIYTISYTTGIGKEAIKNVFSYRIELGKRREGATRWDIKNYNFDVDYGFNPQKDIRKGRLYVRISDDTNDFNIYNKNLFSLPTPHYCLGRYYKGATGQVIAWAFPKDVDVSNITEAGFLHMKDPFLKTTCPHPRGYCDGVSEAFRKWSYKLTNMKIVIHNTFWSRSEQAFKSCFSLPGNPNKITIEGASLLELQEKFMQLINHTPVGRIEE